MPELAPIAESPMVLSWTVLATSFLLLSLYMRAVSSRQYPRVAWLAYIVLGGAILLGVTFRHVFHEAHVPYLRILLLLAAVIFGAAFFVLATAYADSISMQSTDLPDELR